MPTHNTYIYILIMALVTYLVRVLPLTLIRKEIKNITVKSFLYYVPYVTLAIMTFPAILSATSSIISAAIAFVIAIVLAWIGKSLFQVAMLSCASVFIVELVITFYRHINIKIKPPSAPEIKGWRRFLSTHFVL